MIDYLIGSLKAQHEKYIKKLLDRGDELSSLELRYYGLYMMVLSGLKDLECISSSWLTLKIYDAFIDDLNELDELNCKLF